MYNVLVLQKQQKKDMKRMLFHTPSLDISHQSLTDGNQLILAKI